MVAVRMIPNQAIFLILPVLMGSYLIITGLGLKITLGSITGANFILCVLHCFITFTFLFSISLFLCLMLLAAELYFVMNMMMKKKMMMIMTMKLME